MRAVVQRSGPAKCEVDGKVTGSIIGGLVVLVSVDPEDTIKDIEWMGNKISGLRIFSDSDGKMNRSLLDVVSEQDDDRKFGVLSISQFTLHGNARKGFRPSFVGAAPPDMAEEYYKQFNDEVRKRGLNVEEGIFGAMMNISLINEGPVTILIDSKHKF
ncbi:D-tyrosyl-tRNA(Tyr) deacylase [bacterium]|nr:D-tyrosyl-tRNA(Tyr) deacylase [bacterium]